MCFVKSKNKFCQLYTSLILGHSHLLGLISILGWCLFSAFSRVLTSNINQTFDPIVLCFYTFLLASVIFTLLNFFNFSDTFRKLKEKTNFYHFVALNISTFGAWFFLIYPLKYIEPAIVSTITLGLSPVATLLLSILLYQNTRTDKIDIVLSISLCVIIAYTIYLCFRGVSILHPVHLKTLVIALVSCIIVGFATAAQNFYAKKLSNAKFKPMEVLALRFLLTIVLSGIILFLSHKNITISKTQIYSLFLVASCLVIVPLYLAQIAIKYLEPITVALVAPFMPVIVFFFEWLDGHIHPAMESVLSAVVISALILAGIYIKYQKVSDKNVQ